MQRSATEKFLNAGEEKLVGTKTSFTLLVSLKEKQISHHLVICCHFQISCTSHLPPFPYVLALSPVAAPVPAKYDNYNVQ